MTNRLALETRLQKMAQYSDTKSLILYDAVFEFMEDVSSINRNIIY